MTSSQLAPLSVPLNSSHLPSYPTTRAVVIRDAMSPADVLHSLNRDNDSLISPTYSKTSDIQDLSPLTRSSVILRPNFKAGADSIEKLSPMESSPYYRETATTALRRDRGHDKSHDRSYDTEQVNGIDDAYQFYSQFVPLEAQAGGRKHKVSCGSY